MNLSLRRMFVGLLAAATMSAGAVVTTLLAETPQPAHASTVGGLITRSEVLARAKWWVDTYGVIYSQKQVDAVDSVTGDAYRPDCSGFVSMAWHLPKKSGGWDRSTEDLNGFGDTTNLSSLSQLLPGDAILFRSGDKGHVALFDHWVDTAKTEMFVYEEYEYGHAGRRTIKERSAYEASGYIGVRYHNIVTDDTSTGALQDFTGDSKADILARWNDGTLYVYPGNGSGDFGARITVGSGWNMISSISAGDVTGDGRTDIVGRNAAGKLLLYTHTGAVGTGMFSGPTTIGSGWNTMSAIHLADIDCDGYNDIVARDLAGALWVYPNDGGSTPFAGRWQVGSGWNGISKMNVADVDGDGRVDVLARAANGDLRLYAGAGNCAGSPWDLSTYTVVGTGWNGMDKISTAYLQSNGRTNIVAANTSGTLLTYLNAGGASFSTGTNVGSGWHNVTDFD
jgi:hypothetical protein